MRPAAVGERARVDGQAHRGAMATGSAAREMALAARTRVAAVLQREGRVGGRADAGVEDDRDLGRSTMSVEVRGVGDPCPLPIGEPSGMTAAQPTSSSRRASTGSSVV